MALAASNEKARAMCEEVRDDAMQHGLALSSDASRTQFLREMVNVALAAVSAEVCVPPHLPAPAIGKTLILGIGKAGASMARVASGLMEGKVEGIVLTRYGHSLPPEQMPPGMVVFEAGHPIPDKHGLKATQAILAAVKALGPDDQLLALVSGGGSALLTMPATGITLNDKRSVTRALLLCGASISEINCVRTHLSRIKGGRLAIAACPARVVTLAFSDIPGDDPALIASGPTVSDRTRLADAQRIVQHYNIPVSDAVRRALADPENETPTAKSDALPRLETKVIARSHNAQQAAGQLAHAHGYTPVYLGDIEGDATETGVVHAALALHHAAKGGRWALLSGGETTVVVRNSAGRGGRNSEYLASLACALAGATGISAIACDTDGIDGTEDNAGAVIDPTTLARGANAGLGAHEALQINRTYDFFARLGDLVITGPTRTNVNDLRIILIDA